MNSNKYVVVRVVKRDGTCVPFYQCQYEHMIMLGADNEVCITSGERKLIIDLKDVAYIKIKEIAYGENN